MVRFVKTCVVGFALVFALSACEVFAPHVHDPASINREHPNFAKDPEFVAQTTICYLARATTPQTIYGMAKAECGKYGLIASYSETSYTTCPATTPQGAVFQCLDPRTGEPPEVNEDGERIN